MIRRLLGDFRLSPVSSRDLCLAIVAVILFVAFSALFVLGQYQSMAGDMGQYITHARNLLWGRPWGLYLYDFPAVLPGYSLLLAIPTALAGLNMYVFGLMNSVMWAVLCITFFAFYYKKLPPHAGWIFLGALLFNPFVLKFQQEVQPNIFYGMATALALFAGYRLLDTSWRLDPRRAALLALAVLFPAVIRQDCMALYLALILYFVAQGNRRLALLPFAGIMLALALDSLIAASGQFSTISVVFYVGFKASSASSEVSSAGQFIHNFLFMFTTYMHGFTEMLVPSQILPNWLPVEFRFSHELAVTTTVPRLVITAVFVAGFLRGGRLIAADKLFFGGHVVMLSLFLLVKGTHFRYLIPVFPIYVFYFLVGLIWLLSITRLRNGLRVPLMGMIVAAVTGVGVATHYALPAKENAMYAPEMVRMVDWIKTHQEGKGISYYKNRLLLVMLDETRPHDANPDPRLKVKRLRESWQAENYKQESGHLMVVHKFQRAANPEYFIPTLSQDPSVERVYEDKTHVIFKVR